MISINWQQNSNAAEILIAALGAKLSIMNQAYAFK